MKPNVVWTIAGFDPSGGAGVTADLMTFAAHGLFGCSAITALTVQSTLGVLATDAVKPEWLAQTLQHLHADLPAAGIKIGMLGNAENMVVVAGFLGRTVASHATPVVLDPVLRSSSGRDLFPGYAVQDLRHELLPLVDFVTPNWIELAALAGHSVTSLAEAAAAARFLISAHPRLHVVATGGDGLRPIDLLVTPSGGCVEIPGTHISTEATHGTGCAFSTSLLSRLVLGDQPEEACRSAKLFVETAMRHAPGLGGGKGPLDLLWPLHKRPYLGGSDDPL